VTRSAVEMLSVDYTATVSTPDGIREKSGLLREYPINWASLTGEQRIGWWRRKVVRDGKAASEADVLGVVVSA
jgi:hypothetical protein